MRSSVRSFCLASAYAGSPEKSVHTLFFPNSSISSVDRGHSTFISRILQFHLNNQTNVVFRRLKTGRKMSEKETEDKEGETSTSGTSNAGLHGMKVLATQVGGHMYGQNGSKIGMLDRGNGVVLKALQKPPRGTRELWLYQTTFAPACQNSDLLELRHFLPLYCGTEVIDDVTFLVMHNVAHNFSKPNILDVKMGRVTYDPEASEEKKRHELNKYPPLKQLGFMLTGMMVHDASSGRSKHFPKKYCRSLAADSVLTDGLGKFFGLHNGCLRKDVVQALLSKLRRIESWFQVQRTFAFYASSLLIVYNSQDHNPATAHHASHLQSSSVTALLDANGNESWDPLSDCPVSRPSFSTGPCPGSPGESSGKDKTSDAAYSPVSGSAAESTQRRSEAVGSGTSGDRLKLGQKRKRVEGEGSLAQSASLCKLSRRQAQEEGEEGVAEEGGASETEIPVSCLEKKQGQVDPLETDRRQGEFSENEADTGVSESTLVSGNSGMSENNTGTISSCVKVPTNCKSLKTSASDDAPLVDVRMIDFAHVFPASDKDTNYLFGLQKLISLLEQLLKM